MKKENFIKSGIFGLAVADALGVPVEFKSREYLKKNPVIDMMEFGTHHQPKGTWSDDSSLTFCLADSLCNGYNLNDIAQKFLKWYNAQIWTPHGSVFDIGIATHEAILHFMAYQKPEKCGGSIESKNGNGSLMRILPLAFYLKDETDLNVIFQKTKEVSSITHAHFRSVFACFIYIIYAIQLIRGFDKNTAYIETQNIVNQFVIDNNLSKVEIDLFNRILQKNISLVEESEIKSSGYVLHSLEASFWCILNSNSYRETVLKAVNLGDDTDTTSAIAGGLAGIIYGYNAIPKEWIDILARKEDISELCERLLTKLNP